MNLYDDNSVNDSYSISIQNNISNMSLANNVKDLSNLSKARKRRIVKKIFMNKYLFSLLFLL